MTEHDILRDRLLGKDQYWHTVNKVKKYHWSDTFIERMRNRMIVGAYRYGLKVKDDLPSFIRTRLKEFEDTKNSELLIDIANVCMIQFTDTTFKPIERNRGIGD